MNGPDRYSKIQGKPSGSNDGTEFGALEGLDPVTGLPVLIYDFDGEPLASPGDLDSENIPRILWSGVDGGRGRIVAALSPGWQRLDAHSKPLSLEQLTEATAALRAASASGVAHGDLAPWRLLLVGDRLQVEGYGVPWRPRPGPYRAPEVTDAGTEAGDVWSLAAIVGELGVSASDETVAAVLEQCLAKDPLERPSADELFLALEALAMPKESETSETTIAGERATEGPSTDEPATEAAGKEEPAGRAAGVPAAAPPSTDKPATEAPGTEQPGVDRSESTRPGAFPAASESRSNRPPGTSTYRESAHEASGQRSIPPRGSATANAPAASVEPRKPAEGPGEKRRRLTLLGALMAAVIILALLALYGPRGFDPPAPRPLEDVVYVVEVNVVPADLPPVTIHLIRVPQGSSLARSDSIGTAPRHLALDRAGTWAFQGSLQGRRSEVVEIEVPEERTVTLVMPAAEQ